MRLAAKLENAMGQDDELFRKLMTYKDNQEFCQELLKSPKPPTDE